jgi:hypothetical protein
VFERFEVVEIEATDGTALGIEVDVTDHEAVTSMVARVVEGLGSGRCPGRESGRRSWSAHGYQGQHPRSGALTACRGDESVRDRLLVQRGRPDHEAAALQEDHHG